MQFSLLGTPFGGNGAGEPFVGLAIPITAGDRLTIGGSGLSNASVSGPAASTAFGAWVVSPNSTSTSVIFVATANAMLFPGAKIAGFQLTSASQPTATPWVYAGQDDLANAVGIIATPTAPPKI